MLKQAVKEKDVVDFSNVSKKDKLTLNKLRGDLELELLKADEAVEAYLKDEKLTLDSQFVMLVRDKKSIEHRILALDDIIKEYV